MPYVLISTQIRLETGPTMVGDEYSDPSLMAYLGARKTTVLGNNFSEYHVEGHLVCPEQAGEEGVRVISMTGVGQTLIWCLHKKKTPPKPSLPLTDPLFQVGHVSQESHNKASQTCFHLTVGSDI
ncbi:GTP cyclohydrolase 1 feedback regulatory protein [Protopterus annectens]|uniref:GTP cyclohydrolase 1 feedback regulatory protein n=1 Tax=Protopterus annectens TaxID=7888 RepID=UPI001CFBF906|nr:GTP cyclohydrolase 1 feedback regulatory protein [Protopterus annectens]